jgi:Leucine-rich repeat (LRR) protein
VLDAKNNSIEKVYEELGGAGCLERLDLSKNKIVELPESIGRLTALSYLNLSGNQELKKLP